MSKDQKVLLFPERNVASALILSSGNDTPRKYMVALLLRQFFVTWSTKARTLRLVCLLDGHKI